MRGSWSNCRNRKRSGPAFLTLCCLAGCGLTDDTQAEVYVSVDGNDAWDGSRSAAFRTVARAQQAVRAINRSMTSDIVVNIAPGVYELAEPLSLTDEDSGFNSYRIIYRSDGAPGSARLLGGTRITEWRPFAGAIVAAHVPFEPYTLYEDGVRADVARFPDRAAALPLSRAPYLVSAGLAPDVLEYAAGDVPAFVGDLAQLQVYIWPFEGHAWFTDTVPVRAIDPVLRQIHLAHATRYRIGRGSRYVLQGAASLISAPGEFFYDRTTSTLYYWPRASDVTRAEVVAPRMPSVVTMRGMSSDARIHDVVLDGLWLAASNFTDWYRFGTPDGTFERQIEMPENRLGLVTLENTERIEIVNSRISHAGFGGIYLLFANQHNRIAGNLIEHVGINGITLQGPFPGTGDVSHDNVIANNLIRYVGELAGNAAGIDVSNSGFNQLAHNWIHDSVRYGVMIHAIAGAPGDQLYAHGNVVEYTRIERTCQDSGDTAALYGIGVALDNTAPRPNTFRQLVIDGAVADPSMRDLAPNGVFMDLDTAHQVLENITVGNTAASAYRSIHETERTMSNVSWLPGYDPGRIELSSIGLGADFPAEYLR